MRNHAYFNRGETRNPKKVEFTVELLEWIGEQGKSQTAIAKDLKVSATLVNRAINKSITTRDAFDRGRKRYEQRSIGKV
jgi:transposase